MRNTFVIIIIVLSFIISCSSSAKTTVNEKPCHENLEFKKVFFENVHNVENLVYANQNKSMHNSLRFISKYSDVSFASMANYARSYPGGVFEDDKKIWLKWYEDNKCKDIQFKDSISK